MRILPLSRHAKEEIDFIYNMRQREFATHHNYSTADTSYQTCVDLYYLNSRDIFIANNGDFILNILYAIVIIILIKYISSWIVYRN